MLELEGKQKAFRGTMRVTPVNPDFPPFEMTGDWMYKPIEGGYWYGNGHSFGAQICEVVRDDTIPTIDPVKRGPERILLIFSKRKALADRFEKWCVEHQANNCPVNVISFLYINGLLDVDKAYEKLEEWGDAKGGDGKEVMPR